MSPTSFRTTTLEEEVIVLNAWHEVLASVDYDTGKRGALEALKRYTGYELSMANVLECIQEKITDKRPSNTLTPPKYNCAACNGQQWLHPQLDNGQPDYRSTVRCLCWMERNDHTYVPKSVSYWRSKGRL
ncbi:MAG: hypothetical protein FWF37_01780 [Chloroflexi bacterium]|nr:hypothetical protein [Chloroflexota bacterium]